MTTTTRPMFPLHLRDFRTSYNPERMDTFMLILGDADALAQGYGIDLVLTREACPDDYEWTWRDQHGRYMDWRDVCTRKLGIDYDEDGERVDAAHEFFTAYAERVLDAYDDAISSARIREVVIETVNAS